MNINNLNVLRILLIILCLVLGLGSIFLFKKKNNPVEQAAEAVLKTQGIDIDFSKDLNE
jgi:hypothetical protein